MDNLSSLLIYWINFLPMFLTVTMKISVWYHKKTIIAKVHWLFIFPYTNKIVYKKNISI